MQFGITKLSSDNGHWEVAIYGAVEPESSKNLDLAIAFIQQRLRGIGNAVPVRDSHAA